jgi:hypothetical protein
MFALKAMLKFRWRFQSQQIQDGVGTACHVSVGGRTYTLARSLTIARLEPLHLMRMFHLHSTHYAPSRFFRYVACRFEKIKLANDDREMCHPFHAILSKDFLYRKLLRVLGKTESMGHTPLGQLAAHPPPVLVHSGSRKPSCGILAAQR